MEINQKIGYALGRPVRKRTGKGCEARLRGLVEAAQAAFAIIARGFIRRACERGAALNGYPINC